MKKLKKNTNCEMVAYRFYGIPSEQDLALENKTFGCCRYLWNRMLSDHNELYRQIGEVPQNTPADYKDLEECRWLNEVDSLALANVQINQDGAFSRFFKKEAGYPKFKSKKLAKKSYTTNAVYMKKKDGTLSCNIVLDTEKGFLKLPKHKDWIQLRMHREIQEGGKIKSVTVTLEADGKSYYSILVEYPKKNICNAVDIQNAIGLDMSMPKLYVDQNGSSPDFPKPYRKMEQKIKREQRKLSRKKKDSKNYEKQRIRLAKQHAKAKHLRSDVLHKESCSLTDRYDLIAIEDLDMSAMKQALRFGKSVSDNGWGMFVQMLSYKCERKGKKLVKVDRFFPSSKTCCKCGYIHKELVLTDRTYICPKCGNIMDRDEQAAKNILSEARRLVQTA